MRNGTKGLWAVTLRRPQRLVKEPEKRSGREGHRADALALRADEGRDKLR